MRRAVSITTWALIMASTILACTPAPDSAGDTLDNLVLISIDTLRADHLGTYGYDRDTSPWRI